ncbi:threonine synthase [candidate division KSB1 bacterium]|nr:threonine synthase [candidate division KSB1 bacterium]
MAYTSWLQCVRGCDAKYSIFDVIYRCEKCGGLLDVEHDVNALTETSAADWRAQLEQRMLAQQWPLNSGVWNKKEWVCPQIDVENIVSLGEGNSPLQPAFQFGESIGIPQLWVKQCGTTHTGSFKDLGMTALVSVVNHMMKQGSNIQAVACASTGDTSAALAAYGAAAGMPTIVFLPKGKISTAQLVQPIAHGALVLALDTDFDGCMKIVQEVTADQSIYLANSMNSLRIEGQKTVGMEIVQQMGWSVPDWIVIPAGNLGNVSALGKGLLLLQKLGLIDKLPRIACAQAKHANPLYLSFKTDYTEYKPVQAKKTLASAIQIGAPVSYERAVKALKSFDGIVEQASEDELANIAAQADRTGLYACPQTAVAMSAMKKLVDNGIIQRDQRVVVISTAHGLKFSGFKVNYHDRNLPDVSPLHANPPVELPADVDTVKKAIAQRFN